MSVERPKNVTLSNQKTILQSLRTFITNNNDSIRVKIKSYCRTKCYGVMKYPKFSQTKDIILLIIVKCYSAIQSD